MPSNFIIKELDICLSISVVKILFHDYSLFLYEKFYIGIGQNLSDFKKNISFWNTEYRGVKLCLK